MEQFPVILIPNQSDREAQPIPQVEASLFPIVPGVSAPQPPRPPRRPGEPPKRWDQQLVLLLTVGILCLGTLLSAVLALLWPPLVAVLLIGIPLLAITVSLSTLLLQLQSYPKRLLRYQHRCQQYQKQRQRYQRALLAFAEQERQHRRRSRSTNPVKRSETPPRGKPQRILRPTVLPDGMGSKALRGRSERTFGSYLKLYFPGKIQTGLTFTIPGYAHPYTPDFAYIDREQNLYIDIEIDEPYQHGKLEPLHYLGSERDERRNAFFLNRGWVVIRFSEEQVIRTANSCCKTIAETIAKLSGDRSIMAPFADTPNLKPMPRWTKAKAKQMALEGYRNRYS